MSLILSIETATPVCAVALHNEGVLLGEYRLLKDKSHSEKLALLINNLVKGCDKNVKDLAAVAISEGPGSYTGLRIGTSTAKGLCFALSIPLIAVNSLTALAAQMAKVAADEELLLPMFDARRMEVYCQVLDKDLKALQDTAPVIIDERSFINFLEEHKVYLFGDGAGKCKPVITHPNAFFVEDVYPGAATVGELAFRKYLQKEFVDMAYFEPVYLKEFRAGKPKSLV
jgi:tRNA threonylcarbamoyladenosine biosynthesis protein TsaB